MKTNSSLSAKLAICLLVFIISGSLSAQVRMGVLPVNVSAVQHTALNNQQWNDFAVQMQEHLIIQLGVVGQVNPLTREHVLLALEGMPKLNPDNLNAAAIKELVKREKYNYLLFASFESIKVTDKEILIPANIILYDDKGGSHWKGRVDIQGPRPAEPLNEDKLLNEVVKPSLEDVLEQLRTLKY
ncbi:MAG: hypothetical protein IH597_12565 [Bacteroidales bacterium]|nr:hypothetical protein [Bacteroidales bacterium]